MELIAQGKTNKEIASALGLSDKTIKNYLSQVYEKLQVTRRAHATRLFVERTRTLTTVGLADFSCPS
jgi:DNA-binding NarL/FixJ family response regulator